MAQLLTVLDANTVKGNRGEKERVLAALQRAASVVPYNQEQPYFSEAVGHLTGDYLAAAANERYRVLPDEAFALKKRIDAEVTEHSGARRGTTHKGSIEVPLFAYVKLGGDDLTYRHIAPLNRSLNVRLTAQMPGGLTEEVREAGMEALGFVHGVIQEAYRTRPVGDVLLSGFELRQPQLGVLWIPTTYNIEIITREPERDPDPALILDWHKKFLVRTWDVKDEEPLRHYLREFLE